MRYELSFTMEFVGSEVVRVLDIVHPNKTWLSLVILNSYTVL
jgi:hypothetical protein